MGVAAFYFSPERPAIWAGFYWVLVPFWSFFGGGVILKPTSLWSFFIAFAALAGGFQLLWENSGFRIVEGRHWEIFPANLEVVALMNGREYCTALNSLLFTIFLLWLR